MSNESTVLETSRLHSSVMEIVLLRVLRLIQLASIIALAVIAAYVVYQLPKTAFEAIKGAIIETQAVETTSGGATE